MELLEFMAKAKGKVYSEDFRAKSLSGGDMDLPYSKGRWHFSHTYRIFVYAGLEHINSQIRITENERPRWLMDTHSRITSKKVSPEDIHEMLRHVVLDFDEYRPFLLPRVSRHGNLTYISRIKGDYKYFKGDEMMIRKDKTVFEGTIEGGLWPYTGYSPAHNRKF